MKRNFDELDTFVGGLFKIKGEPIEAILQLVKEWKDKDEQDDFVHLTVRVCSGAKDAGRMVAIDFLYDLDCSPEEAQGEHEKFFHKYSDQLRRCFGNNFVAWDVSTPVYDFNTN